MSTLASPQRFRAASIRTVARLQPRLGLALTGGAGVLAAIALVLLMPRGPLTSGHALTALGVGLLLGLCAGAATGSRWPMLVLPFALAAVFELRWAWLDGPTVDAPRFDSSYGVLALILGRGFFGLLLFVPLLLGVAVGAGWVRRRRPAL